jgi:hypothetical protein
MGIAAMSAPITAASLVALVLFNGTPAFAHSAIVAGPGAAALKAPSAAYELLDWALEATAREHERHGARPTIGSRMLAIIVTSMYDAWAAYDPVAQGTRLGADLRRPPKERTEANKRAAMAYGAYQAMLDLFPDDEAWLRDRMQQLGYSPANKSTDLKTPAGVGNAAAAAVITFRHHDGANQLGDEPGSTGGPYSDYTFYRPVNSPDKVVDPDRWQQIPFERPDGSKFYPSFLTPHWYRVIPFGLSRSDQFRPPPPPKVDSAELRRQVDEVIKFNGSLTLEQKAIVEFMRDGPRSTGQSGHWLRFAQALSRRDSYDLDRDIKLFFVIANTAMDAFIAAWDSKRFYDSSRPWTLVRHYYAGEKVRGWLGPGKGVGTIPAEQWRPYSPAAFPTPAFPGYVSGHSTVSGACAWALEMMAGDPRFEITERRNAGELTEPAMAPSAMQLGTGDAAGARAKSTEIALDLPTFDATAKMAGISRIMGGYHVSADNTAGLDLGRKVASYIWVNFGTYFTGRPLQR